MRRYGNLWGTVTSMENLENALRLAKRRKHKSESLLKVTRNPEAYLTNLQSMLVSGKFHPSGYKIKLLFEPKLRILYAAPFYPDRIVHHAIMRVLEPIYESFMHPHSYSCRKGKGQHKASDRCMRLAMRYKYCLQCDCSQFYINIDHEIMKRLYRWKIKDARLLSLLDSFLDSESPRQANITLLKRLQEKGTAGEQAKTQLRKLSYTDGLFDHAPAGEPIGNLLSQWDGNLYMTAFDYYVTDTLGCKAYIRFCDDFLLFSDDKAQLAEWKEKCRAFLLSERKIVLSKAEVFPTSQGVDFCGYRHFHDGKKLVRKRTARRASKRVKALLDQLDRGYISAEAARSKAGSTWGILKHAKTYNLRKAMGFDSVFNEVNQRARAA